MEFINCNFCKQNDYKIKYQKNGFDIVQCNNCSLVYVNPRLTQQEISKLYDNDYFEGKGFDRSVTYGEEFNQKKDKIDLQNWDLATIREFLKNPIHSPQLLDVGAGMGLFLWKAKKTGFAVKGLELSTFASDFIKSQGIDVDNSSINEFNFHNNFYDVIIIREVIEHLPNPFESLMKLHSALKENGVLFLTTGNYNCPERLLKGSNWFYFMPEGHLTLFSHKTIKMFLQKAGFRKIVVTNQGDLLMNFLLKNEILETERFKPKNPIKRIMFELIRGINHFISSGLRVYAIK